MQSDNEAFRCCIAGGGPAGMVLGLLLARAGVRVLVLEKHRDFLRDFRGDTVHPSTLEVLHELGLLQSFLQRPHDEIRELRATVEGRSVPVADFTRLPTHCQFLALMPQWDFLDFVRDEALRYPGFTLWMDAEATGLIEQDGRIAGVTVTRGGRSGEQATTQVHADLVVAADGRHSVLRDAAKLPRVSYGSPIDVLWMRIPKLQGDPESTAGHIAGGRFLVMLNRGDYWQCAFVIAKGGNDALRSAGIEAFRDQVQAVAPFLAGRLEGTLPDWDAVKLLEVTVDRLTQWSRGGLLCIGDAAHAMSPVGGVGINLAVQDAVATANLLAGPLSGNTSHAALDHLLPDLQQRREWPVRVTQAAQRVIQQKMLAPIVGGQIALRPGTLPLPLRLVGSIRLLRGMLARAVGLGVRREHVRSPSIPRP